MKHLRKFNESVEQKDDILSIFAQLIDDEILYYMEGDNETSLTFTSELYRPDDVITDLNQFEAFLQHKKDVFSFYEEIEVYLKRLENEGYYWSFEVEEDISYLNVYFKNINLTLDNAFGPKNHIGLDAPVLKSVLKRDYNLTYHSNSYTKAEKGYYGSNAYFNIYVSGDIEKVWNKLKKDIESLTKEWSAGRKEKFVKDVSKSTYKEYSDNSDRHIIKVEVY